MEKDSVVLIDATRDPIKTIANAYRTCRSSEPPWGKEFSREEDIALIKRCLPLAHRVPLEQCYLVFGLMGQSRVFSAQFLRSRLTSPVQQSQRAVSPDSAVFPDSEFDEIFEEAYFQSFAKYSELLAEGVAKEDARYVLPMSCSSNIQIAMNLSEFIHICNERLCYKAQAEYRLTVQKMIKALCYVGKDFWTLFSPYFSPKCHITARGFCREREQCTEMRGIVPTLEEFENWCKNYRNAGTL